MTENKPKILVVEDDDSMQDFLTTFLEREGYEVRWASHGGIAQQALAEEPFDVVITDIIMPEVDGVEVLDHVKAEHPDTSVIIMTGRSSVRQAVELIRRGADDYFKKPFDIDEMLHVIRKSLDHRRSRREAPPPAAAAAAAAPEVAIAFPNIIGHATVMLPIFEMIGKVADTNSTVLIQGQSGTGKELVAQAIHRNSSRNSKPFIPVHCGAIPESLLESELFGHEKGSFTGAIARKEGVFKLADGGTLFLDEVSEMSVPLQVKLLRVLETGSFRRVGGQVEDLHVDVRVVAATNRELRELVDKNLFRQDLYYRLNVFPIVLPPLRDRHGDVPALVDHFCDKLRRRGSQVGPVTAEALGLLEAYDWPGNVRELVNVIERAVILSSGEEIECEHLPLELRPAARHAAPAPASTELTFREAKSEFEKHYLEAALGKHAGSVANAAEAAGMSRAHFYELIKKYKIDLARFSKR